MIREITEEDFEKCINVIRESFMTVAEEFYITRENAPAFTAFATDENKMKQWKYEQHRPMYGYFEDGKLVGYYNLMINEDMCEVGSLCVLPEYRHKNIGKALLDDAISKAKELHSSKMILSIVEENKVLRKWYEDQGFVHLGTKKFDFFPFTCGYLGMELTE